VVVNAPYEGNALAETPPTSLASSQEIGSFRPICHSRVAPAWPRIVLILLR
jgi:hypothetical protein